MDFEQYFWKGKLLKNISFLRTSFKVIFLKIFFFNNFQERRLKKLKTILNFLKIFFQELLKREIRNLFFKDYQKWRCFRKHFQGLSKIYIFILRTIWSVNETLFFLWETLFFFGEIFFSLQSYNATWFFEQYCLKDHLQLGFFKCFKEYFRRSIPNLAVFKELFETWVL